MGNAGDRDAAWRGQRGELASCALPRAVIVTAGGDGVAFADRQGQAIEIAAIKARIESAHGVCDEFAGAFAAAFACGQPIKSALHAANRAAGRVASSKLQSRR